jgi:dTDP-4-amino-4,6-dideoxygalactose transaminase
MSRSDAPLVMLDLDAQREAIGPVMEQRIGEVLRHGQFILGPEVKELEEVLAARAGVRHVVTCGNGTDALQIVLMAWGIGPGDAVFVPSFTFTATAEVVALLGATPIFCDVHQDTFNLDVQSLTDAIDAVLAEGVLVPRAVIPVDLFGLPADYPAIQAVAARYGLRVLGDAAQSYGATLDGRPVGSLAEATATSFFPAKPLGCYGDGGAVFTDDDDLAAVLRSIRVHGKGTDKYDTVRIGLNSRLDTLQAAILLAKLTVFDDEIAARQEVAARYTDHLDSVQGLATPSRAPSAWAQYTIRIPGGRRDEIGQALKNQGVPTAVYYPRALADQPAFRRGNTQPRQTPKSTAAALEVISLPMHPYLTERQAEVVSQAVAAAV